MTFVLLGCWQVLDLLAMEQHCPHFLFLVFQFHFWGQAYWSIHNLGYLNSIWFHLPANVYPGK